MDVQQLVAKLQQLAAKAAADPLAVPMAGSLAGLVLCIALLYWCAAAGERKQQEQQQREAGGTVFEGGVRRSTRQVGRGLLQGAWRLRPVLQECRLRGRGVPSCPCLPSISKGHEPCLGCRVHRQPTHYSPEKPEDSPAPAKTPRAAVSSPGQLSSMTVAEHLLCGKAPLCLRQALDFAFKNSVNWCMAASDACPSGLRGGAGSTAASDRSCALYLHRQPTPSPVLLPPTVQRTPRTVKKETEEKEAVTVTPRAARPRRC